LPPRIGIYGTEQIDMAYSERNILHSLDICRLYHT